MSIGNSYIFVLEIGNLNECIVVACTKEEEARKRTEERKELTVSEYAMLIRRKSRKGEYEVRIV